MEKVSVIVPVYKVEQYLPRCIESLLKQTLKDIQIILVDDGSPDRSGDICDYYAKKDSRIMVIHQQNGGVSAARNAGLLAAKGEYIGFVDSDDWVDLEMFELMYEKAHQNDADIAVCGFNRVYELDVCKREEVKLENKIVDYRTCIHDLFAFNTIHIKPSVWNKLFRKTVVSTLFFMDKVSISEDLLYVVQSILKCKKIIYLENAFYFYLLRSESAIRGGGERRCYIKYCLN